MSLAAVPTRPLLSVLLLALLAACAAPDGATRWFGAQRVHIDNPYRAQLTVTYVGQPPLPPDVQLGDAPSIDVALPLGASMVVARRVEQEWRQALPMHATAVRPDVLTLFVRPPRAQQDGLVWIPAGPALIGDELGVGQESERPARVLDVPGFWMGNTEVSNGEFVVFLNACDEVDPAWFDAQSRKVHIRRGDDGRHVTDAARMPIVTVSHAGAIAYCEHKSRTTGKRYRLPTEIEWEKAARGPQSFVFAYGNVCEHGLANQATGMLAEAGSHAANGFGLVDMTGNAFEWTADVYDERAYERGEVPASGEYRALRGGSFVLDGVYLRNSMRMKLRSGVRADDVGFRVVCEPEDER